jgi:hypothetical protein
MRIVGIAILIGISYASVAAEGGQNAAYSTVEIDRFVSEAGVDFPADYQISLVEDLARELKRTFKSVDIIREGEPPQQGKGALRITGVVTQFKPGSRAKRYLIGFGAGATVVEAQIKFIDVPSGEVQFESTVQGTTWIGIAGGGSDSAGDRLAKKITMLAKTHHLIQP